MTNKITHPIGLDAKNAAAKQKPITTHITYISISVRHIGIHIGAVAIKKIFFNIG